MSNSEACSPADAAAVAAQKAQARWSISVPLVILSALLLASMVIGAAWLVERENRLAARAEMGRIAAAAAQDALDRGDDRAAIDAVLAAWAATEPPLAEARAALTRVMLETRLLADIPLEATKPQRLRLLPDGTLSVVEAGGRTHLVHWTEGRVSTVYDPALPTFVRISEDGETLWTAHFEAPAPDGEGGRYAPLVFEEAALSTGEIRFASAVRSVPPQGVSGDVSPDGTLFAADLGPGGGAETVIGVFRREAQALAGLIRAPADVADVRFIAPDRLIAAAPPAPGIASGVSLWRLGDLEAAPLSPPPGACAGPRATPPAVAPEGAEIAVAAQGCLLRWSGMTGAPQRPLRLGFTPDRAFALAEGGPYLVSAPGRASLLAGNGRRVAVPECKGAEAARLGAIDGREVLACGGSGGTGLLFGPMGHTRWAAPAMAAARLLLDPAAGHLFAIGADGHLRIWDAAPRAVGHSDGLAPVSVSAVLEDAPLVDGSACTAPWARDPRLLRDQTGGRAALATEGRLSVYNMLACAPVLHLGTAGAAAALTFVGPDLLEFRLGGELLSVSLGVDPEAALTDLRLRRARMDG